MNRSVRRLDAQPLKSRVESTAAVLRAGLLPLAEELAGSPPRPSRLVRRVGLDKSLASRLIRALRSDDALEFMHLIPSPPGLRILLDRAIVAEVGTALVRNAEEAIDIFQELLDAMPGGRASLEAHISESRLEVREKQERSSKQAVYKAMSFLLGYYCETLTTTLFLQPSENGRVDGLEIHQRLGLRRLRSGTPLAVLSVKGAGDDDGEDTPRIETLEGERHADQPSHFLLEEYCSDPLPELQIVRDGLHTTFAFGNQEPGVEAVVDLTSAFRIRNGWPRFREEGIDHCGRGYLLHLPCKTLVRDLFIHDDLYVGSAPEVTIQLPNPMGTSSVRPIEEVERLGALDLSAPVEQLRPGIDGVSMRGLPSYPDVVSQVTRRVGWEVDRFRGYRCTISYPVPMLTMTWWVPLPEPPR